MNEDTLKDLRPLGPIKERQRLEEKSKMELWKQDFFKTLTDLGPTMPEEVECPDGLLPDGDICPGCGKRRGPSGIGGGTWVHY
jgi:hypothetical protein